MFQKLFGGAASTITQLSVVELQRKLAANESLQLIDVRSTAEYQHDGYIVGAKLIPLSALAQRLGEIDRAKPVVLICHLGNRSQVAADLLAGQGFDTVSNLQGGMSAWRRAGYPAR